MAELQSNEIKLTGTWIMENGKMRSDATCERIEYLISHYLKKIAISDESGGWKTLYKDPNDGRYWEHTYPHGEMHGGGPPQLIALTLEQAKVKYRIL